MRKKTLAETLELNKIQRREEINARIRREQKQKTTENILGSLILAAIILFTTIVLLSYIEDKDKAITNCQTTGKTYNQCLKSLVN